MDSSYAGADLILQIVGAGPAGIGMLLALCNRIAASDGIGTAEQHILDSLQIFEASDKPGGKMEHYQINANTSAFRWGRAQVDDPNAVAEARFAAVGEAEPEATERFATRLDDLGASGEL